MKTREERMNKRKEAGKIYTYKKNPFEEETSKWLEEEINRSEKRKSKKLPFAHHRSVFAKLDNRMNKEKAAIAKERHDREKKEKKNQN